MISHSDEFRFVWNLPMFGLDPVRRLFAGCLALLSASFPLGTSGAEHFTYEKIHFTDDGTATGTALVPNYEWDSCWWALGNDDLGNIFVAISNHEVYPDGNVAIFKYDPAADQMTFLDDLKSVSTAAGNWQTTENQQKVHTRLIRGGDGRLYFATHDNSWGSLSDHRGTHFYAIEDDVITDLSAAATKHLNKDMETIDGNIGVHIENYATMAMEMTPGTPRLIYGITYGDGYFYRLNLENGDIKMITQTGLGYADGIIRNFAVDLDGNAYVPIRGTSHGDIRIHKYDNTAETWTYTGKSYADSFLAVKEFDKSGWLLHVYTKARDMVYFIAYDGKVYRFTFATETLDYLGVLEANPNPRVNNLIISDDEQRLYALVFRYAGLNENKFVEFDIPTGMAATIDSDISTYGNRDLLFGGPAKDRMGHAYLVGWKFLDTSIDNIALFKIGIEPKPTLTMRTVGTQLELEWNHGLLQTADDTGGPWTEDASAFPPLLVDPDDPRKFFRLRY
ncbi:hypothetical protein [Haloferula sp.]|uniref:hypothetical protein n=1 Tax=Haloferula sp. TaxID=2497595 RepID=UPI00329E93B9